MINRFSVVISTYINDNHIFLKEALDSVINQSAKPDEIVLVFDGPVSKSQQNIVKMFESRFDINLRSLALKRNQGPGVARHFGIKAAKNEIIAIMDSDDISRYHRFEKQLDVLKNTNIDLVGGFISEFKEESSFPKLIRKVPKEKQEIYNHTKFRSPTNNVTIMFRKSAYMSVGGYGKSRTYEDYELFYKLIINDFKIYNIQEVLVDVRSEGMISRRRSFQNFKSKISLYSEMRRSEFIKFHEFILNILIHTILFVLPKHLIATIYNKFLRN